MVRAHHARYVVLTGLALVTRVSAANPVLPETGPAFTLTATMPDLERYFPAYLANGFASTLSGPRGTEGNPAYLVAFMDYGAGDISRPAAIPGWTEIDYSAGRTATGQAWLNKTPLVPSRFQDYRQQLNLRDATLTTSYTYVDGTRTTAVEVATFVDEAQPHLAITRISITPDFDGTVQLSLALNLWAPPQPRLALGRLTGAQMEEAVQAQGRRLEAVPPATPDRAAIWYRGFTHAVTRGGDARSMTLWLDGRAERGLAMAEATAIGVPDGLVPESTQTYRSAYRLATNLAVKVLRQHTYSFTKYVAFSRAGWGGDAQADLRLAKEARAAGYERLLAEHRDAWHALWQSDILIDGDERAQQTVHSELYYLLASSTRDTAWPLGACALTPGYAGHVFWDADTWIFPALLLLHPERARPLVMFRGRTLAAAVQRAHARGFAGAMFPWEADPESGREQTPHFAGVLGEREIHVNADVAIAQWQYYLATGDQNWLRRHGWPVIREVARFWASRAKFDTRHARYEIRHVTSVNEAYSDVSNDTFTNASAAIALGIAVSAAALIGERPDPVWADMAQRLYIPVGGTAVHHLEFAAGAGSDAVGSGSTLLLSFPSLDLPMSTELRRNDYEAGLSPQVKLQNVTDSMGLAPTSIAAAAVGDSEAAVAWFERNFSGGTLKPPFAVRTETAENNTGYFLTGSGGFIQNLLYGFTGLRIREQGLTEAYPPMLPTGWRSLTLRNISFRGRRLDVEVARDAAGTVRLMRHND